MFFFILDTNKIKAGLINMDAHHFNFHLNHAQAMLHPPAPTSSPPQSVPGRR